MNLAKDNMIIKAVKQKRGQYGESPVWGILVKDKVTKTAFFCDSALCYRQGWSQGTNRSELGYYLQSTIWGGASNGSGQESQSTPNFWDSEIDWILEDLERLLSNSEEPRGDWREVPYNSKISDLTSM